ESTLRWMAVRRAGIEKYMPEGTGKSVVSLRDLSDAEFSRLVAADADRPDSPPVALSGSSREMYRMLRSNPPRFAVYQMPKFGIGESLTGGDLSIEGMASDVDLTAEKFDPGSRNKVMLLWSMIGVIQGVRQPILGFVREGRENGLLYSIEPRTESLGEHIGLAYGQKFGEEPQRHMGEKLADLFVRTANKNIIPRGACRRDTICVGDTGELYFKGGVVFQASESPQLGMNFMIFNLGRTHFRDLEKDGFFPPAMQRAFLEKVDKAGLLDVGVAGDTLLPEFRRYEAARRRMELPPTKPPQ
ncbi:MAG: hypothetical protein PHG85_07490, partial [Candidatus Altiarchaeota archaeon]|nr:hypothetical protein [Candidatus Altiarchaeota archaeon]